MTSIVSFGVPRLDDAFGQHGRVLLVNDPGVDARPFLLQAAARALGAGQAVVYLSIDRAPRRVVEGLRAAGATSTGRLRLLDAHSSLHGIAEGGHAVLDAENVEDVVSNLEQARHAEPGALLVVDSINGLALRCGVSRLAAAAGRMQRTMQGFPEVLASYTQWNEELALRSLLDGFPDRIHLQGVHERITTHEFYRVERLGGQPARAEMAVPVLFRSDGGRVRAYVPKLLVTGPADAGKTTFIHAVCDRAVSTERAGKTVAMDRGHLERNGIQAEVFGTPGQERFDAMMAPIMAQAVGVVLMVDSTQPASFDRAMEMLGRAWRTGIHAIIAANKQDLEGALSPGDIAKRLSAPTDIPIIGCQAASRESAMGVVDQLLHRILSPGVAA